MRSVPLIGDWRRVYAWKCGLEKEWALMDASNNVNQIAQSISLSKI